VVGTSSNSAGSKVLLQGANSTSEEYNGGNISVMGGGVHFQSGRSTLGQSGEISIASSESITGTGNVQIHSGDSDGYSGEC